MSINRVCITGNLTRDPEMMATQTGTQILRLGMAVNDRVKNQATQQWEDRPNYIDCVMFGNRAQGVAPYLHKGSKVSIEGKLRWSQWQDRDTGKNRSKIEVIVDEIELMQQSQQQGYQQAPQAYQPPQGGYAAPAPQPAYQQPAQQAPQRYQVPQAPAQTYAPQQAPQVPPQAQAAPPAPQPQQPQQPAPVYDADIPF